MLTNKFILFGNLLKSPFHAVTAYLLHSYRHIMILNTTYIPQVIHMCSECKCKEKLTVNCVKSGKFELIVHNKKIVIFVRVRIFNVNYMWCWAISL